MKLEEVLRWLILVKLADSSRYTRSPSLKMLAAAAVAAFSSRARIFFNMSFPACAVCFDFCFVFWVEISSRTLIPLFWPGSVGSGSASWDDCDRVFPDGLRVTSFPDRFPHYAWTAALVSPLRLRWVKGVCVFRCNLPLALLAEWPGSFKCHCGNTGVEWKPNKSQHTKLTLEKKILPPLLPGFELAIFR